MNALAAHIPPNLQVLRLWCWATPSFRRPVSQVHLSTDQSLATSVCCNVALSPCNYGIDIQLLMMLFHKV